MPRDREYLREILEAIDSILEILSFADFDRLMQTRYLRSAILHELTVIGEASARLPDDLHTRYPDVPWPDIIGLRHVIVHGYFTIDWNRLWMTITLRVPEFRPHVVEILDTEFSGS
jgi:uncharacterized protein with HEPN domain